MKNKIIYLIIAYLLVIEGCNSNVSKNYTTSSLPKKETQSIVKNSRATIDSSFKEFINNIVKEVKIICNSTLLNYDKIPIDSILQENYLFVKKYLSKDISIEEEYFGISQLLAFKRQKTPIASWGVDSCNIVVKYKNKQIYSTHNCHEHIRFNAPNYLPISCAYFRFGQDEFITLETDFSFCMNKMCRANNYILFVKNHSQYPSYSFRHFENIVGLRAGDVNTDGYLDFLYLSHDFTESELEEMNKRGLQIEHFYKLKIVTFKKGKWQILQDKKNKEYFMFIKLDKNLDINSKFEILNYYWFKEI